MSTAAMSGSMSETRQLVVFALGHEEYAFPIVKVREVIRYAEPRTVNASSFWVRGVISLRGQIIPIVTSPPGSTPRATAARPPRKS